MDVMGEHSYMTTFNILVIRGNSVWFEVNLEHCIELIFFILRALCGLSDNIS